MYASNPSVLCRVVATAVLAIAIALPLQNFAAAEELRRPIPVTVTNPVTIANPTTSVTVANPVTTVTVANPVNAVTIANTPLLVRDADHPARHHFHTACLNTRTTPGQLDCTFTLPYNVRQLHVIETVTANFSLSTGAKPASMAIETTTYSLTAEHALVPIAIATGIQTSPLGTVDTFAVSGPLKLYADNGTDVVIKIIPASYAQNSAIYATISGYSVDCGPGPGPQCELP